MYNFNDNREAWKKKLAGLVQQAHRIAPGKPVYPYMWPGYHGGTAKAMQLLTGDYWQFQLEAARDDGADGLIIWGNPKAHWKDKSTWREDTVKFMAASRWWIIPKFPAARTAKMRWMKIKSLEIEPHAGTPRMELHWIYPDQT